jgi:alpha-L-fucosidase
MFMKKIGIILLAVCLSQCILAQKYAANWQSLNQRKIPAWFHQDKFGIFIHWGVYAVPAYAPIVPNTGYSYAEWYWKRQEEKYKPFTDFNEKNYGAGFDYQKFEPQFKAELFQPDRWADIFKRSGARYVVLTSKHHEGYCLWNSAEADRSWQRPWNSVTGTPKRDLLGDLTESVRNKGLKMGYYYSMYEWFNPLWLTDKKKFIDEHLTPQFKDLVTRYKPAVIFSDGEWDLSDTAWKSTELLAWLFNESPVAKDVVVNDRWGNNTRGKNTGCLYSTSEYGSGMDASVIWEESQGIGLSYGYNRNERIDDYKNSRQLILMLADIVSRGGNLLLDIGPAADGTLPVIMEQRLLDIGDWLKINGEAIYESEAYKQPYQWSKGIRPGKKDANFMADYDITKMVTAKKDSAYIECLFTRKNKDLYCIIPAYTNQLKLADMQLPAGTLITLLGTGKKMPWKQLGKEVQIDFTSLHPGDINSSGVFAIKLPGVLK